MSADKRSSLVGTRVTTVHAVVDHAPGRRDLTGLVVRTFLIGKTTYAVVERADGVQGTAAVRSLVPA